MYTPLTLVERYTATLQSRQFAQELERGLRPRNPDMLFDMVGALGLGPTSRILDIGCGTGWAAFRDAGFGIERKDEIGGEWREYRLEHDERGPRLGLDASRLLRGRGHFVRQYGEARYEQALADAQWLPFILLGKLVPAVYLLRKGAETPR